MSGRPTSSGTYGHGMARIFKESVKNIRNKDRNSSSDILSENKTDSKTDIVFNEKVRPRPSGYKCRETGAASSQKHAQIGEDCRKTDEKKNDTESLSSLFSCKSMEKSSRNLSYSGFKKNNNKQPFRKMDDSKHKSKKPLSTKTAINHFTEDWGEETLSEDTFKMNIPQNGSLQSTPKKQSNINKTYEKLSEKSDAINESENNILRDDEGVIETVLDEFDSGDKDIQTFVSEQKFTKHPQSRNNSNINMKQPIGGRGKVDIMPSETTVNADNGRVISETHQSADLKKVLCIPEEYLPPLPEINNTLSEEDLIGTKEDKRNVNGKSNFDINGRVVRNDFINISKQEFEPFKHTNNKPYLHEKEKSFVPVGSSNYHNYHRKSPSKWISNSIAPRFLKANNQLGEPNSRESEFQLDNYDRKPWKKLNVSQRSHAYSNKYNRPVHRQAQTNFSHGFDNRERDWKKYGGGFNYKRKEFSGEKQFVHHHDLVNCSKENANVVGKSLIDNWDLPCSEDWSSEMSCELENILDADKITDEQNISERDEQAAGSISSKIVSLERIDALKIEDNLENICLQNILQHVEQYLPPPPQVDTSGSINETDDEDKNGNSDEKMKDNCLTEIPYLPPPPPISELELVQDIVDTCDYFVETVHESHPVNDNGNNGITENGVPQLIITNNGSTPGLDLESGKGHLDKAQRDVNQDYFGSGTSEADISELPSDDVADIISSCSDYLVNHNSIVEGPVIANSQECSVYSGNTRGVAAAPLCPSQHSDYNQCNRYAYTGWENEYRDWWNMHYDAAYWHWYYNMYLGSCREEVNSQQHPGEGSTVRSKQAYVPEQDVNKTVKCDFNPRKGVKHQLRKMETLEESLQLDLVTERTTEWVNSHVVDDNVSLDNVPAENQARHKNAEIITDQTQTPASKETVNDFKGDFRSDLNGNIKENDSPSNNAEKEYSHVRNHENSDSGCYCSRRDVSYVTWRFCKCRPPSMHAVYAAGENNPDLGYCSYESNLDHENPTFQGKDTQLCEPSGSVTPHYLWNPTTSVPDWKDKTADLGKPYLYEQLHGSRIPPYVQQVYMLHSSCRPESSNSSGPEAGLLLQNTGHFIDHKAGTDENGNKIQPRDGTGGKLRTIIDSMNQESRLGLHGDNPTGPSARNSSYRTNTVGYNEQELPSPYMQSGAHLSQVETSLTSAEKTNSELGKSFSIMKNAISAIRQYTDQLHGDKENGNVSSTPVLDNELKETKKVDNSVRKWPITDDKLHPSSDKSLNYNNQLPGARPRITPFVVRRREKQDWGSSSGPISESSDDICRDSILSQSPDTRNIKDTGIPPHYLLQGAQDKQGNTPLQTGSSFPNDIQKMIPRHRHSYRGGGAKLPGNNVLPVRPSFPGYSSRETLGYYDAAGHYYGHGKSSESPIPGSLYGPQYDGPIMPCNPNVGNKTATVAPSVSPIVSGDHKTSNRYSGEITPSKTTDTPSQQTSDTKNTPSKYADKTNSTPTRFTGDGKKYTPIQRRLSQLVDYGNSDDSSSEPEIEPFDVNSLSSDFDPRSMTEDTANPASTYPRRPKKFKQDTTSDEDSTPTPPLQTKHIDQSSGKKPVTFIKRPQRKLSHKHLKSLPSNDFPAVTFDKSGTQGQQKPQQPHTIAEMISMSRQEHSKENNSMAGQGMSPYSDSASPALPPLPPFPQSQFWSMYLPKYNSALTGKQETVSPKPEVRNTSASPVTPEWNRPKQRRSWGGAACAIASPSDTESETRKDWRTSFRRFHNFGVKYIDTHCHLDFLFKREGFRGNLKDYMEKCPETFPDTFEGCVAVFCNPMTFTPHGGLWMEVAKEDNVWIAMGCHPKMATDFTESAEVGLQKCLTHSKCVALGEIGLDYSGSFQQYEHIQKRVFRRQLTIALEMKKPLVIHCRDAEQDCLDILKEMVPRDYKIHCHCFTGFYYNAKLWMDAFPNLFIGVTPLVTFRTATPSHDLARNIPLNRLLLETDAPYFIPRQIPKEDILFSNPGLAITVAKEIAQFQELPVAAVLRHCRLNTKFMYGI